MLAEIVAIGVILLVGEGMLLHYRARKEAEQDARRLEKLDARLTELESIASFRRGSRFG